MCSALLLGIGGQLGFEGHVFFFVGAARARPGDGPVKRFAALHFHQHFGRAANDGEIVQLQKIHVRRRIHDAQGAINLKRVGIGFCGETLADGHLKNIAGANVFLGFAHRIEKFRARRNST